MTPAKPKNPSQAALRARVDELKAAQNILAFLNTLSDTLASVEDKGTVVFRMKNGSEFIWSREPVYDKAVEANEKKEKE